MSLFSQQNIEIIEEIWRNGNKIQHYPRKSILYFKMADMQTFSFISDGGIYIYIYIRMWLWGVGVDDLFSQVQKHPKEDNPELYYWTDGDNGTMHTNIYHITYQSQNLATINNQF